MHNKSTTKHTDYSTTEQLWDEITKSIADKMPKQLLPLIKEAFHKEYPEDAEIKFLSTEHILPSTENSKAFRKILSDISFTVNKTDLYHLECQMTNDHTILIRMIEYDTSIALQNGLEMSDTGEFIIHFPKSTVMYPDSNDSYPDSLSCTIIFPDDTRHRYQIPTIKVQSYSLQEIEQKHLNIFIPFMLLQFRSRINSKRNPIKENELTEYVKGLIFILKNEFTAERLTEKEFQDFIKFIELSANRVFHNSPNYQEEVYTMTKSKLWLPSDELAETKTILSETKAELAREKSESSKKDAIIAQVLIEQAQDKATIKSLQEEVARLKNKA